MATRTPTPFLVCLPQARFRRRLRLRTEFIRPFHPHLARGRILLWDLILYEGNPLVTVDLVEQHNTRRPIGTLKEREPWYSQKRRCTS